jgi:hypothetical protein
MEALAATLERNRSWSEKVRAVCIDARGVLGGGASLPVPSSTTRASRAKRPNPWKEQSQ